MMNKPLRADALRNHVRIVEAATTVFAEDGAGGSFEEIARRAGVGSATLHRRFSTRAALFEAVYAEQVEALLHSPGTEARGDPTVTLEEWLGRFLDFIVGKRAFAEEMAHDTELVRDARRRIYATVDPLLAAAKAFGTIRSDVSGDDVLRMLSGVGLADYPDPGQRARVLQICARGLRT